MINDENREILSELLGKTSEKDNAQPRSYDDEIINLGDKFSYDGFQVVRREFFAHTFEPSAVFNNCRFSVNTACLRRFPEAEAVQVLINRETKVMALLPCPESAKDSFNWCTVKNGVKKPRPITCKLFFAKIVDLMGWNPDYRYKMLGKLIRANDETLIAFDLSAAEVYRRTLSENGKPKTSRTPVFPAEWQNQFGLPYAEHKKTMQINIFDGYAVYSLKDIADSSSLQEPEIVLPEEAIIPVS